MQVIFEDEDLEELIRTGKNNKYKKFVKDKRFMKTRNNTTAFRAVHPGEVLKAELEERGITQTAFAEQIGMRVSHLNELIRGKRAMTINIADKIEEALGIDSIFWMNMQTQYNYDIKAQSAQEPKMIDLKVSIEDTSLLTEIKRAIGMIRGVGRVAVL